MYSNVLDIPDIQSKLLKLQGAELKYSQLCSELNLMPKATNSKNKQLTDLELFCDMETLEFPTRYRINEVYDKGLLYKVSERRNKFQMPIEGLILSMLEANEFKPLYCKSFEVLSYLTLLNENYSFIKNPDLRNKLEIATGEDYHIIADSSIKAAQILYKWVERSLKIMESNFLISYHPGYVLYKRIKNGKYTYITKYEVPVDSPDDQKCMDCYKETYDAFSFKVKHKNKKGEMTCETDWIPNDCWRDFYNCFNAKITKEFEGKYDGAYRANVITVGKRTGKAALENYRKQLNAEAQRKIKETKQLNSMTGFERDKMIEEIITCPPKVLYKNMIPTEN